MALQPTTRLCMRGYSILKAALSVEDLDKLKKDLTVTPHLGANAPEPISFKTYAESDKRIYIPKSYGLKHFGLPDENRLLQGGREIDVPFQGGLRPEQMAPVEAFLQRAKDPESMGGIIALGCGQGKCLGRDTSVLMYPCGTTELEVKAVQDVNIGDVLVGDDSTARVVTSVCSGWQTMYTVTPVGSPVDSKPYVVNGAHILTFMDEKDGAVLDINVEDYLEMPAGKRERLKGFGVALVGRGLEGRMKAMVALVEKIGTVDADAGCIVLSCADANTLNGTWRLALSLGLLPTIDRTEQRVSFDQKLFEIMTIFDWVPHTHWCFDVQVEKMAADEYFGFEVSGINNRFLLADMTVTHNTVCALHIVAALRQKTLIVVHKDFLLNQWRERIAMFLPSARIGIFKAKTIDVHDKDIIIGSLQSLSMKQYDAKELFGDVGLVCIDECHRTGAEVFSKVYKRINAKHTLGLSATVARKDGMSKVFKWHIGDVVYKGQGAVDDEVHVYMKAFVGGGWDAAGYGRELTLWNGKPNMSKMINVLCDHVPRLDFIVDSIDELLGREKERKVLVLSDRRAQLHALRDRLADKGYVAGFYYGGMRPEELKVSEEKQILLATYAFCAEGLDVPKLDTLVLASPKSDIVQSVGRILREKPKDRCRVPIVIDVVDRYSLFGAQANKRQRYYGSRGFKLIEV